MVQDGRGRIQEQEHFASSNSRQIPFVLSPFVWLSKSLQKLPRFKRCTDLSRHTFPRSVVIEKLRSTHPGERGEEDRAQDTRTSFARASLFDDEGCPRRLLARQVSLTRRVSTFERSSNAVHVSRLHRRKLLKGVDGERRRPRFMRRTAGWSRSATMLCTNSACPRVNSEPAIESYIVSLPCSTVASRGAFRSCTRRSGSSSNSGRRARTSLATRGKGIPISEYDEN